MDNLDYGHEFEWNDIYTGGACDYLEPDAQILEIIEGLKPGRALDVGCGSGGLLVALAERGWEVTGIDIAPKAIEAARNVLEERGLEAVLQVADASKWRPSEPFDLVTNSFALPGDKGGQAALFQAIRDALAVDGTVVIKDFDASMKRHAHLARFHCPTIDELRAAFDGLEILRAEVVETPAHDDSKGQWTAALLHARRPDAA